MVWGLKTVQSFVSLMHSVMEKEFLDVTESLEEQYNGHICSQLKVNDSTGFCSGHWLFHFPLRLSA
jgi:hypothetical protein